MDAPIWISSMTGGAERAGAINKNLALACKQFGLGMGLGSCRPLLDSDEALPDFSVRKYIGDQPLFTNLGIAQVEQLLAQGKGDKIIELIRRCEADGLILHINPLQEWLQPEGDRIAEPPLDTIKRLIDLYQGPLIVKEVGQGFGPASLQALMHLPLEAIEFGAQGGTNFSLLEAMRRDENFLENYRNIAHLGHTALEMTERIVEEINLSPGQVQTRCFIASGGISDFLDGYYFIQKIPAKAIYAQAAPFLKYALLGEEELMAYTEAQIRGLELAYNYLRLRKGREDNT